MRSRFLAAVVVATAMLAITPVILAQTTQQSGAAQSGAGVTTPDLSGVWQNRGREFPGAGERFTPEEPQMQPWAEERYKMFREGVTDPTRQGRIDKDPMMPPHCMLPGMPKAYMRGNVIEIIQAPGRVYILFEADPAVQRIYTDGRKHTEGAPYTFMGHSIGRWEGDTLVAETVNTHDFLWIDGVGHPRSDEFRVEQRIRRVDATTLEMSLLFDDPKTYKKPWGAKKIYKLNPRLEMMEYILCETHLREMYFNNVFPETK